MLALRQSPLLKIGISLFIGLLLADEYKWNLISICLGLGGISLIVLRFDSRLIGLNYESIFSLIIAVTFMGIGGCLYLLNQKSIPLDIQNLNCQEVVVLGVLKNHPTCKDDRCQVKLKVLSFTFSGKDVIPIKGNLLIKGKKGQFVHSQMYDTVSAIVFISDLKSPYLGYVKRLSREGILYVGYLKADVKRNRVERNFSSYSLRKNLIYQLHLLIKNEKLAEMACAILLGKKDGLSKGVKEAFANAGASHILTISGLHVGILFSVFSFLFHFVKKNPYGNILKNILIILLLWSYLWLIDSAPAAFRAVLMFSCVLGYRILNGRFQLLNVLGFSGIIHMLLDPLVVFSLGFQLSYIAVIGILCILPKIEAIYSNYPSYLKGVIMIVGISGAASLGTFPLIVYHFGQFPTYFLLTNICLSFLASCIVSVGILTIIFVYIPYINAFLGYLLNKLLYLALVICTGISELPGATITKLSLAEMGLVVLVCQFMGLWLLGYIWNKLYVKKKLNKNVKI